MRLCSWVCLMLGAVALPAAEVFWPTPNAAYFEGADILELVQPTASGNLESGLFGCVRNGGARFHEGLDLKPVMRTRDGEAADPIFSVMAGKVAHVSSIAGNSSYGRYIVVETAADVPVYMLYAHLAAIEPGIRPGVKVEAGQRLGTMGRSAAGYSIPRSRAHLHYELGVVKTNRFEDWYRKQKYGSPNKHGDYNGLNLIGANPLEYFEAVRAGRFTNFAEYFDSLPTAFTLRVSTRTMPDFILRYPRLLTRPIPKEGVTGWDIDYTWYGLPKRWTPLTAEDTRTRREGDVTLVSWDEDAFEGQCRGTLIFGNGEEPTLGNSLKSDLRLMFDF